MADPSPADPFLPPGREVLYSDDALLVVSKPAGVLSHPNARSGGRERVAFAGSYDQRQRRFQAQGAALFLVHRLDQETSGVLLAARTPEAHARMVELFEAGQVEKRYRALLARAPRPPTATWADHMVTARGEGRALSKLLRGRPPNARLHVKLLATVGPARFAHVRIRLETGRTHQIRVQAAARRCAVLGDRVYGDRAANKEARRLLGLGRLFLHAEALVFAHPSTGRRLEVRTPLPADLEACLSPAARR